MFGKCQKAWNNLSNVGKWIRRHQSTSEIELHLKRPQPLNCIVGYGAASRRPARSSKMNKSKTLNIKISIEIMSFYFVMTSYLSRKFVFSTVEFTYWLTVHCCWKPNFLTWLVPLLFPVSQGLAVMIISEYITWTDYRKYTIGALGTPFRCWAARWNVLYEGQNQESPVIFSYFSERK